MTIETQTRDVLLRAADAIGVEPPPIDTLLGSAARRRRRIAAVVAGLSAAAVVVAVAIVSTGGETTRAPHTSAPSPTTAPGTRLVGMNGVMVSVPDDWGTNRVKCGTALADTVYFDTGHARVCRVVPRPDVSVLSISDAGQNGSAFQLAQDATEPTRIDGVRAMRWPTRHLVPSCPASGPLRCTAKYVGTLYFPSLAVVLSVSSPHPGVVDPILDSAHLIPDGYIAIPVFATANELEALGLTVDLRGDLGPDRVAPTDPPVGSVVSRGSTVRIGSLLDDMVPDPDIPVTVSDPLLECGPTGGPAMSVLLRSPVARSVRLEIRDGDHVDVATRVSLQAGLGRRVVVALDFAAVRAKTLGVSVLNGGKPVGHIGGIVLSKLRANYQVCF